MAECEKLPSLGGTPAVEESMLAKIAEKAVAWTGSTLAFTVAVIVVLTWAVTGPIFQFSDTWQLVINTGTTIVTFLMVFLLQRAQNKDSQAIHLKLNELVAATSGSSNRLIAAECLTEGEMELLTRHYKRLVELSQHDEDLMQSHSVEEAADRHVGKRETQAKTGRRRKKPSGSKVPSKNGK